MDAVNVSTHQSNGPDDTHNIARRVAEQAGPGSVLALSGELGAGKTCFVQGLALGLGVDSVVNSPTYTIIHEYKGNIPLYHIDLYRIRSEQEAFDIGLDDYIYSAGVTAIEWPERAASALPESTIHIRLEHGKNEDERVITISHGPELTL